MVGDGPQAPVASIRSSKCELQNFFIIKVLNKFLDMNVAAFIADRIYKLNCFHHVVIDNDVNNYQFKMKIKKNLFNKKFKNLFNKKEHF